jgi:magnesium transporter
MFRVMDIAPGGQTTLYDGLEAITRLVPPPEGVRRWIDLEAQDAPQLEALRAGFDFHPLAIEDCLHLDQRPKLEAYREVLFVVIHGFHCGTAKVESLEPQELHAFLGERFLVTVHAEPLSALEETWRRVSSELAIADRGPDFFHYLIIDGMADDDFPVIDRISEELEELEEGVLDKPNRAHLSRLFALKHELATMRRVLSPQRDVVAQLAKVVGRPISERTALYYRDVYDHVVRLSESIDANRDLLGNALDAYLSAVGNRTNEIMKTLTLMSAVFLPLTFLVGFFGQNFDNLPGLAAWVHSDALMWVMIAGCVVLPTSMVLWFKSKDWL